MRRSRRSSRRSSRRRSRRRSRTEEHNFFVKKAEKAEKLSRGPKS